jgi:hypothetical protein
MFTVKFQFETKEVFEGDEELLDSIRETTIETTTYNTRYKDGIFLSFHCNDVNALWSFERGKQESDLPICISVFNEKNVMVEKIYTEKSMIKIQF